jgi:hypothetical protein
MTDLPTLTALRDRIKEAKKGTMRLDGAVLSALAPSWFDSMDRPRVTTSIDAAIALCERVYPGWDFALSQIMGQSPFAGIGEPHPFDSIDAYAATLPLALCLAIVQAKIYEMENE